MIDDMPDVVIIPKNDEEPSEIIEDYAAMITYNLERGVPIEELLYMFFNEINMWTCKQYLIDTAKQSLQGLEDIHNLENEFIEDDEDE